MPVRWFRKLRHHRSDPVVNGDERPCHSANISLRDRAAGEPYATLAGLHVTVTALDRDGTRATEGANLVLTARVENPTAEAVEFDNSFGIVDGHGNAFPRGYADPLNGRPPMPPSVMVEPGAVVEGAVYVHLEKGTPPPFRSALLTVVERGCSSCPGGAGVDLIPLAVWQATLQ